MRSVSFATAQRCFHVCSCDRHGIENANLLVVISDSVHIANAILGGEAIVIFVIVHHAHDGDEQSR